MGGALSLDTAGFESAIIPHPTGCPVESGALANKLRLRVPGSPFHGLMVQMGTNETL